MTLMTLTLTLNLTTAARVAALSRFENHEVAGAIKGQ
jgi:hypothetical protein